MKEWNDKYNPFNSAKLFAHIDRWKRFQHNDIPMPVLVTIDPTNICNLNCVWCNAAVVRERKYSLSEKAMDEIVKFIGLDLNPVGDNKFKVKAVCVAGGGEPFCNRHTPYLLKLLHNAKVHVGIITNGTIPPLHYGEAFKNMLRCEWVGVSVDAGTAETYSALKRCGKQMFHHVIRNMNTLIKESNKDKDFLPSGVSYKYLVHPDNIKEMYIATLLAKSMGCRYIHFRPVGVPWNKLDKPGFYFMDDDVQRYNEMISKCFELSDEKFGVIGQTHKYDEHFDIKHNFKKCYATYMTAVFGPSKFDDAFDVGLCCDRRGDGSLELGTFFGAKTLSQAWGSTRHRELTDAIILSQCPRCTYSSHNEFYQNVILERKVNEDFI